MQRMIDSTHHRRGGLSIHHHTSADTNCAALRELLNAPRQRVVRAIRQDVNCSTHVEWRRLRVGQRVSREKQQVGGFPHCAVDVVQQRENSPRALHLRYGVEPARQHEHAHELVARSLGPLDQCVFPFGIALIHQSHAQFDERPLRVRDCDVHDRC
jgi:hypothetical protein